jgi:hypothetical protein
MLLQVARQSDAAAMHHLVDKIAGEGMTREEARRFNRGDDTAGRRARRFVYRFKPEDDSFAFTLSFARPKVERHELIRALLGVLERLRDEEATGAGALGAEPPCETAQA